MGSDWSLTDNCVTSIIGGVLEGAGQVILDPDASTLAKSQASALVGVLSPFGAATILPSFVESELNDAADENDWISDESTGDDDAPSDDSCCGSSS